MGKSRLRKLCEEEGRFSGNRFVGDGYSYTVFEELHKMVQQGLRSGRVPEEVVRRGKRFRFNDIHLSEEKAKQDARYKYGGKEVVVPVMVTNDVQAFAEYLDTDEW